MLKIIITIAMFVISFPVLAIVNLDSLHFDLAKLGMSGSFSLGMYGARGNTQKILANTDGHLKWNFETHTNFVLGNYQYGQSTGVRDTNKAFIHLRHIHKIPESRNAWELFAQLQSNEFTRLSLRSLLGGGYRIPLHKNDKADYRNYVGLGAFYSREKLDPLDGISDSETEDETDDSFRANFYVLSRFKFTDTTRLFNTFYYQPDVTDLGDFRVLEVATLKVVIKENLDLKLSIMIAHDSKPPQTVDDTDSTYTLGIEYSFE